MFYTGVIHTMISFQSHKLIRNSGGYFLYLYMLVVGVPYWCSQILSALITIFGHSQVGVLFVLMSLNLFLTAIYLNARLVARRCVPYDTIPLFMFCLQLTGDFFTGMVFMDFSLKDWSFWVVLVFDIVLLVVRDADLWDDLASFIKRNSGRIGVLVLRIGELLAGADITGYEMRRSSAKSRTLPREQEGWREDLTDEQKAYVNRVLAENCVLSELTATMIMLTLISADLVMDSLGIPGRSSLINPNLTTGQQACQCAERVCSHDGGSGGGDLRES
jgi:hypothetical protein